MDSARALQRQLAELVELGPARQLTPTVVGVDVSYDAHADRAVAVAVTLDSGSLDVVDLASVSGSPPHPYVPGFLSLRELPLVVEAVDGLRDRPELIVVDGHGYTHPARFGLACHLGVETGIPTIGCAKTMFVGEYGTVGDQKGDWAEIVDGGEVIGHVVRSRAGVKPVYVSPGHLIDFDSSRAVVLALCPKYRIPETTRQADQRSRQLLRDSGVAGEKPEAGQR